MKLKYFLLPIIVLIVLIVSNVSYASGFFLNEQSVTGLGRAFAGVGVVGDDLSAIATNPAGMQLIKKNGIQLGVTAAIMNGEFKGSVSNPLINYEEIGSSKVEIQAAIPNLFFQMNLLESLKVGLGVFSPFGLETLYTDNSITKYLATKSELRVIEIAPAVSYNFWKGFTLGLSANIQTAYSKLAQKAPAIVNSSNLGDMNIEIEGDNVNLGGTIGLMYSWENTNIGLYYRSQVRHNLKGKMKSVLTHPTTHINNSKDVNAAVTLPNIVTLSAYHKFSSPLAISGTLRYTQWSLFKELDIKGSGQKPIEENWQDTVSAHIGIDAFFNKNVTLRAGFAYDITPIKSSKYRTARIPDNDRFMLSAGLSAMLNDYVQLDVGYSHIFVLDADINHTYNGFTQKGKYYYDAMSFLVGTQVQVKF